MMLLGVGSGPRDASMSRTYTFIDGAFLYDYVRECGELIFGEKPNLDPAAIRGAFSSERILYYDAERKATDDDSAETKKNIDCRVELLADLRKQPNLIVRNGASVRRTGKRHRDSPVQQKEVDVLLAVDALKHAYQGNMQHAILVANDRDFCPLVEVLVDFGVRVEVRAPQYIVSSSLVESVDIFNPLTIETITTMFEPDKRALCKSFKVTSKGMGSWCDSFTKVGEYRDEPLLKGLIGERQYYYCVSTGQRFWGEQSEYLEPWVYAELRAECIKPS